MAVINYADQNYIESYITEILTELKTWIDTGKNIAIKKVLFKNNALLFFKNPEAVDTDEPQYKIDLPVERFLDQTQTVLVPKFAWTEELYPNSTNPNLEDKPVFVLAVKGVANADDGADTVTYSFLNMETIIRQYQTSEATSTVNLLIDNETNIISGAVNISADGGNSLSIGSDGGLYSSPTDLSKITSQIQELRALYDSLNDRIAVIEDSLNTKSET